MGKLSERLKQKCDKCGIRMLAKRIEGRYINERNSRILIWECVECGHLWQKTAEERLMSLEGVA